MRDNHYTFMRDQKATKRSITNMKQNKETNQVHNLVTHYELFPLNQGLHFV